MSNRSEQQTPGGAHRLPDLSEWGDLINYKPLPWVRERVLEKVPGATVQELDDATGKITLDYYAAHITRMPPGFDVNGLAFYVRTHLNDFIDTSIAHFEPRDAESRDLSARELSPQGAIIHITMSPGFLNNFDDGSVIVSDWKPWSWTFTTVEIPGLFEDKKHPVTGNREFNLRDDGQGGWNFFTRGADRPTRAIDWYVMGDVIFDEADGLWRSFVHHVVEWVQARGGEAEVGRCDARRYDWNDVRSEYYGPNNWPKPWKFEFGAMTQAIGETLGQGQMTMARELGKAIVSAASSQLSSEAVNEPLTEPIAEAEEVRAELLAERQAIEPSILWSYLLAVISLACENPDDLETLANDGRLSSLTISPPALDPLQEVGALTECERDGLKKFFQPPRVIPVGDLVVWGRSRQGRRKRTSSSWVQRLLEAKDALLQAARTSAPTTSAPESASGTPAESSSGTTPENPQASPSDFSVGISLPSGDAYGQLVTVNGDGWGAVGAG